MSTIEPYQGHYADIMSVFLSAALQLVVTGLANASLLISEQAAVTSSHKRLHYDEHIAKLVVTLKRALHYGIAL
jgi:hypothetical protein